MGERTRQECGPIRPAHPDDVATIRELVVDAYAGYAEQVGRTPSPLRYDYERRIAAAEVWVLECNGEVVGVIVLKEEPNDLVIDNVAVRTAAQGKGFGRRLIAHAEREARRRGCNVLRLYANVIMVRNIAIYEWLGFVEIDRFTDGGATRVSMAKQIT